MNDFDVVHFPRLNRIVRLAALDADQSAGDFYPLIHFLAQTRIFSSIIDYVKW